MIEKTNTWVRFAANGPFIKAGKPLGWRCCLSVTQGGEASGEVPLANWRVSGMVTPRNMQLGTNVAGDACLMGVVGWIDLFGDVVITDDDILHIELRDPKEVK